MKVWVVAIAATAAAVASAHAGAAADEAAVASSEGNVPCVRCGRRVIPVSFLKTNEPEEMVVDGLVNSNPGLDDVVGEAAQSEEAALGGWETPDVPLSNTPMELNANGDREPDSPVGNDPPAPESNQTLDEEEDLQSVMSNNGGEAAESSATANDDVAAADSPVPVDVMSLDNASNNNPTVESDLASTGGGAADGAAATAVRSPAVASGDVVDDDLKSNATPPAAAEQGAAAAADNPSGSTVGATSAQPNITKHDDEEGIDSDSPNSSVVVGAPPAGGEGGKEHPEGGAIDSAAAQADEGHLASPEETVEENAPDSQRIPSPGSEGHSSAGQSEGHSSVGEGDHGEQDQNPIEVPVSELSVHTATSEALKAEGEELPSGADLKNTAGPPTADTVSTAVDSVEAEEGKLEPVQQPVSGHAPGKVEVQAAAGEEQLPSFESKPDSVESEVVSATIVPPPAAGGAPASEDSGVDVPPPSVAAPDAPPSAAVSQPLDVPPSAVVSPSAVPVAVPSPLQEKPQSPAAVASPPPVPLLKLTEAAAAAAAATAAAEALPSVDSQQSAPPDSKPPLSGRIPSSQRSARIGAHYRKGRAVPSGKNQSCLSLMRDKWHWGTDELHMARHALLDLVHLTAGLTPKSAKSAQVQKEVLQALESLKHWATDGVSAAQLGAFRQCWVDEKTKQTLLMRLVRYGFDKALDQPFFTMLVTRETLQDKDANGNNMLHMAVASRSISTVNHLNDLLVKLLPEPRQRLEMYKAKNSRGMSALDIAKRAPSIARKLKANFGLISRSLKRHDAENS